MNTCPCGNKLPLDMTGNNGYCTQCNIKAIFFHYGGKQVDYMNMPKDEVSQDKQTLVERSNYGIFTE